MKKVVLNLIAILIFTTCYSQTEKGKNFIGGQISISGNTTSNHDTLYKYDMNSFGFQFNPGFGHLIKNNFAVGCDLKFGISNETQKNEYSNQSPSKIDRKTNSMSCGIGGYARYYKKIIDKFFFYVNGEVSYTYQINKLVYSSNDPNYVFPSYNPANQKVQSNIISLSINPGLVYFVTSKLGIQAAFGNIYYINSSSKNISVSFDNHKNADNYGINLNISTLSLGLNYFF